MDKLRRVLSGDESVGSGGDVNEQGFAAQIWSATSLNWSTRIQGFAVCFVLGFIFSMLGIVLIALPKGLLLFAMFYTIGNLTSTASTMFLMGPLRQIKKMFNETRVLATLGVFLFMILTLVSALWWKRALLAVIFSILPFLAFTWYAFISYIVFTFIHPIRERYCPQNHHVLCLNLI
ncbi:unnamed protein product [Medioppia subpectinata]|uniref:Vesicle transport protein n=1 Tax=Medioppia subpectinata TaxID=1979941 RepID=A0A7R9KI56_9ACAR|nr:unnamed protein product [Medioppia subpectinata]CAG2103673.1 unnamed protein product [Medioppia subpectinata]